MALAEDPMPHIARRCNERASGCRSTAFRSPRNLRGDHQLQRVARRLQREDEAQVTAPRRRMVPTILAGTRRVHQFRL